MNKRHRKLVKARQLYVWVGYSQEDYRWEQLREFTAVARDSTHLMEVLWSPQLEDEETLYNLSEERIIEIIRATNELDLPVPLNWYELYRREFPDYDAPKWHVTKVGIALPNNSPSILVADVNHG